MQRERAGGGRLSGMWHGPSLGDRDDGGEIDARAGAIRVIQRRGPAVP
ncbi:hypothetical protein [Ornithinimicrobium kibberense]